MQNELTGKTIARDFRSPRRGGRLVMAALLGTTFLAGLAVAVGESPALAAAAEDDMVDVTGLTAVSDRSLDDLRGGFSIGPYNVNFGVMIKTAINQVQVLQTTFVVTTLGQISDLQQNFLHDNNPAAGAAQAAVGAAQSAASAAQSAAHDAASAAQSAAHDAASAAQSAAHDAANAAQNAAHDAVNAAQSAAQDAASAAQNAVQGIADAAHDAAQDAINAAQGAAGAAGSTAQTQAGSGAPEPAIQTLASLPTDGSPAELQNLVETVLPQHGTGNHGAGPSHAVNSVQDVLEQITDAINSAPAEQAAGAAGDAAAAVQQAAQGTFTVSTVQNGVHISNGIGTEILQQVQNGVVTQILNQANGMDISHATELNLFINNFSEVLNQGALSQATNNLALQSIVNNPLLGQ